MKGRNGIGRTQVIIVVIVVMVIAGASLFAVIVSQRSTSQTTILTSISTPSPTSTRTTTSAAVFGNYTFRLINLQAISSIDPQFNFEPWLTPQMYERLVNVVNGTLQPVLAKSWSVSPNGTSWTFYLREGVKFHDGSPFNATAVKWSFDRLKSLPFGAASIEENIQSVRVVDTYAVVINTPRPVPLPLILTSPYATYIASPNSAHYANIKLTVNATEDNLALLKWFDNGHSDGTGPYETVPQTYDPKSGITLQRFDGYWRGWKPNQASVITISIVSSATLANQELASGQADWITQGLSLTQLSLTSNNPNVKIHTGPDLAAVTVQFNVKHFPFNITGVRRALAYAVPYNAIPSNVFSSHAAVSIGYVAPSVFGYDPNASTYDFNMTKAHELLTKAGFSGGVVTPQVTAVATVFSVYPEVVQTYELIRPYWAQLGVNLDVRALDIGTTLSLAHSANPQDVYGVRWNPAYISAYAPLNDLFGAHSFFNLAYWANNDFQNTIDAAIENQTSNPAQAKSLFAKAQQILFENAPGIPLVVPEKVYGLNSHWSGYVYNPSDPNFLVIYNLTYVP